MRYGNVAILAGPAWSSPFARWQAPRRAAAGGIGLLQATPAQHYHPHRRLNLAVPDRLCRIFRMAPPAQR